MQAELFVFASGSRGNCALVRCGGVALLVDAGISARRIVACLRAAGTDPAALDGILLTHEHGDHVSGLKTLTRRFEIPVYANGATRGALRHADLPCVRWEELATGAELRFGPLGVRSFSVPHDAAEPVGFMFDTGSARLGFATDLGHVPDDVSDGLADCDALVFEANHDREMLRDGPYPWHTKRRVSSELGHLSNEHAAAELARIVTGRTHTVVLAHISETNNDPSLACAEVGAALAGAGRGGPRVVAARQNEPLAAVRL